MGKIIHTILIRRLTFWLPLLGSLILLPVLAEAVELSEEQVRTAVQIWVRAVTAEARPDAVIERMEPHVVEGRTAAYIAHLQGGGYCLCGTDDLVLPVYFYSPRGTYDSRNPGCQAILGEIAVRTQAMTERSRERIHEIQDVQGALSQRALFWEDLIKGRVPEKREANAVVLAEPTLMELPLTSTWDQGAPYNDQCPQLTPGANEYTFTGCISTALSQIMYYWKWPTTGVGSASVTYLTRWRTNWDEEPLSTNPGIPAGWGGGNRLQWTSANGGRLRMNGYWDYSLYWDARYGISSDPAFITALETLWNRMNSSSTTCSANFGATTYNWSVLRDAHTVPMDDGDPEVAKLCYHAAIAFDTGFGVLVSGSDLWRTVDPMKNFFRYDPDLVDGPPNIDTMAEEIQWLRPIGFSGGPPGHAWVIYGYNKATDPNRQFKMNMGWGGNSGWYTLDNVPRGINQNHKHLTRIAPLDVVKFVGSTNSGDGSPSSPYENIEAALGDAPDGATLIFKAGSMNTFSSTSLMIDRPLTLKGVNAVIKKQ